mmetsp:Transcript_107941/g.262129  ORF Transcript_107941/g.262129 Transcript_107941/m.262129 type:complete len:249 (+) Transcript_107941:128-874(+)
MADSMVPRTRSMSSPSAAFCTSSAEMGGWITIRTPGRLKYRRYSRLLGIRRPVPLIVIGTMGVFPRFAIAKGPFLKSMRAPSLLRVPSGKTKMEVPFFKVSTHWRKACTWDLLSSRSMVRVLVALIAKPTSGIFRMLCFDTHLNGWLTWYVDRMSMKDWWFATKTQGWSTGGKFSRPYTLVLKNGHVRHLHHHMIRRSVSFRWYGSQRLTMGSATRSAGAKNMPKPYKVRANAMARTRAMAPAPRRRS